MIVQKRPKFFSPTIHRWSLCGHTLRTWSRPSSTRLARTLYGCLLTLREVEVPVSYIRGRSQNLHVNAIAAQLRWGIVSSPAKSVGCDGSSVAARIGVVGAS